MSTPVVATFSIVVAEEVVVPVRTIDVFLEELDDLSLSETVIDATQEEKVLVALVDERELVTSVEDQ